MALLTKEDILNANDLPTETVLVPEWGGEVKIRCFTGEERDELENALLKEKQGDGVNIVNHRARVVALAICQPDSSENMFSFDDVKALAKKSSIALSRVYKAAIKLSKMRKEDIEEEAKN